MLENNYLKPLLLMLLLILVGDDTEFDTLLSVGFFFFLSGSLHYRICSSSFVCLICCLKEKTTNIYWNAMFYVIFRLMNNWKVENSSCPRKRNQERHGKRSRSSRHRKQKKTKEKEKLHIFPQRLYP